PPAPPTQRTVALPRLPPRPIDIARAASANAAASQAQAVAVQQERTRDFLAADAAALAAGETRPDVRVELEAEPAAEPSQRQVELAVAATDQLIESLQREGVRRMSVRIILRTGDQSAVEAEAEWEAS
ncbi:MAG: hypothetical protein JWN99_2397, partial [Ilumatobacteraceae bacterium]|nr:hypothetical protein [Ilumatobacteraceae bacterium]